MSEAKPPTSKRAAEPIDAFVGQRIASLRLLKNMSQQDLADTLGVSITQISKYEAGKNRISGARLFHIARLFGVPVEHFFDGADEFIDMADKDRKPVSEEGAKLAREFERLDSHLQSAIRAFIRNIAK